MVCIAVPVTTADLASAWCRQRHTYSHIGVDMKKSEKDPGSHQPGTRRASDRLPDTLSSMKADGKGLTKRRRTPVRIIYKKDERQLIGNWYHTRSHW